MLDVALKFLRDEINAVLAFRTDSDAVKVLLTRIADETQVCLYHRNIGCSVINIEEVRVAPAGLPVNSGPPFFPVDVGQTEA
ncbi:MAG: hypothetical protein LBD10_04335 [Desulfobulbus sp.]|uniref:hypothetical protein n=1 Tax=Desulfobulbus sp. TaxID=895 RepID=UPI00283B6480|nr:hypothetical protein [Desulfobulbus sp.]MDR2549417.1 hypothetical protein [Desulfobulbus sp.]